jgi:hypothetical protein
MIQTSTLQHATLICYRPLPQNTQQSPDTDLYLTTHNIHMVQTSKPTSFFDSSDRFYKNCVKSNLQFDKSFQLFRWTWTVYIFYF